MSPTLTTFLFELANFLLLAALVGWLLFRPVREALESRQAAARRQAEALAAREQAVAEGGAALDARRTAFDDDIQHLRQQRLADAEAEAAAIKTAARKAADEQRARSERLLSHLEQAQVERLSSAVAAAARDAVTRLLSAIQSHDLDDALVRAVCRHLEADASSPGAVVVESAAPLQESARTAISKAAGTRVASLEFRVVPELGGGLRVTTARGLIDASATGLAAHAERALADALSARGEEIGRSNE